MSAYNAGQQGSGAWNRGFNLLLGQQNWQGDPRIQNNVIGVYYFLAGWVFIPAYQHWHTASLRGPWENCQFRGGTVENPCSQDYDFQSTLSLEIGHTLGLTHPGSVSGSADWAHCSSPARDYGSGYVPRFRPVDAAVMCGIWRFTTAQRTITSHLHNYDNRAIDRQHRNQSF